MNTNKNTKPGKKKLITLGASAGIIALGGLSYWYFVARNKQANTKEDDVLKEISEKQETNPKSTPRPKSTSPKPKTHNPTALTTQPKVNNQMIETGTFPIKSGSKGIAVKQIQEALIKTYGKTLLPKFGADAQFGKELISALKAKGFPSEIDEVTFKKIIGTNVPDPNSPALPNSGLSASTKENIDITKNLWLNVRMKKLDPLLEALKRIKSVAQYTQVNELFKTIRFQDVSKTVVNAALSAFSDATSKQFISEALRQIGLKYRDEKWSLSGNNNSHSFIF